MKQQQIVNAYKVIQKYKEKELPLDISYGLFKLKKLLQPAWDFELEEEGKIFDKYHPTQGENNELTFASVEDKTNFAKDMASLLDMESDYDEDKVIIDFNNRLDLTLTDIEALDDFVQF